MTWEPESLSCFVLWTGFLHRLDSLEAGAEQDDLKRAWPVSWNLGFCDSQRYGYIGEIHRGWRQSLEGMHLLHSKTLSHKNSRDGREMASWVKNLLCKCEALRTICRTHIKNLDVLA